MKGKYIAAASAAVAGLLFTISLTETASLRLRRMTSSSDQRFFQAKQLP
jgi:hypothetical protein